MSSRDDQPMPSTGNTVSGGGSADTRELVTTDANTAHGYATSVAAKVTFNDAVAQGTTTGSADVPPLSDPQPATYTLTGIITDQTTADGVSRTRVDVLNGVNAGRATTTDVSGAYTLSGLVADTFRMRASADGFDSGEQNVTVPSVTRADMSLRRTEKTSPAAPCAYSALPTAILGAPFTGAQSSFTLTRTIGTCGWQAKTDVSWLTLTNPAGNGDARVAFTLGANPSFSSRTAIVTVEWTGGQTQVTIVQGTPPDK